MLRSLLTRVGYAALGAAYVTLGIVAARVASLGGRGRVGGFSGAFRYLLSRPHGPAIVAWVAAGLAAFALAKLAEATDARNPVRTRLAALLDALGHAMLAWAALALRWRLSPGSEISRSALAWLLAQPWGPAALTLTGIAVIVAGIVQLWQALTGRLRERLARSRLGVATTLAIWVARFGLAARGTVSTIIGYFLVRAAEDLDPGKIREIGGALDVLHTARFGGTLLGLAGAGLTAYGAYLVLLGFFRKAR